MNPWCQQDASHGPTQESLTCGDRCHGSALTPWIWVWRGRIQGGRRHRSPWYTCSSLRLYPLTLLKVGRREKGIRGSGTSLRFGLAALLLNLLGGRHSRHSFLRPFRARFAPPSRPSSPSVRWRSLRALTASLRSLPSHGPVGPRDGALAGLTDSASLRPDEPCSPQVWRPVRTAPAAPGLAVESDRDTPS